jgi:hypothetical protein
MTKEDDDKLKQTLYNKILICLYHLHNPQKTSDFDFICDANANKVEMLPVYEELVKQELIEMLYNPTKNPIGSTLPLNKDKIDFSPYNEDYIFKVKLTVPKGVDYVEKLIGINKV